MRADTQVNTQYFGPLASHTTSSVTPTHQEPAKGAPWISTGQRTPMQQQFDTGTIGIASPLMCATSSPPGTQSASRRKNRRRQGVRWGQIQLRLQRPRRRRQRSLKEAQKDVPGVPKKWRGERGLSEQTWIVHVQAFSLQGLWRPTHGLFLCRPRKGSPKKKNWLS